MTRERITQMQVDQQFVRLANILNNHLHLGVPTLYQGSHENGITNKLMLNRVNLWPDGVAGTTRRDCYNALRLMISTLGAVVDHQSKVRTIRAMSGGNL